MSVSLPHWDVSVGSSRRSTVAPGEPGRDGSVPKSRFGCRNVTVNTGSFKGTFAGGNHRETRSAELSERSLFSLGIGLFGGAQTQMLVGPVVLIDVFLILSNLLVSTLTRPAQRGLFDPVLTAKPAPSTVLAGVTVAFFWFLRILFLQLDRVIYWCWLKMPW